MQSYENIRRFAIEYPNKIFIVKYVDYEKALDIYREFIHGREMTSMQESCLKEIVQFVCANGDIEAEKIPNIMQLKHINWGEIFNNDIMHVKEFIDTLHDAVVA